MTQAWYGIEVRPCEDPVLVQEPDGTELLEWPKAHLTVLLSQDELSTLSDRAAEAVTGAKRSVGRRHLDGFRRLAHGRPIWRNLVAHVAVGFGWIAVVAHFVFGVG